VAIDLYLPGPDKAPSLRAVLAWFQPVLAD
jgi:hypothetical protein